MIKPPQLHMPSSLRRRALMFVVPVLLGAVSLLLAISYRQGYFERYDEVAFAVDSASGFVRGMPVKLKGLMIGQVKELNPAGVDASGNLGILVTMSLNQRYTKIIPSNSTVSLTQEGLIGQSFVEISPGSGARIIANGESLEYVKRRGLKEILESASSEVIPILRDVKAFSGKLIDPAGDFQVGLQHTVELTRQFPELGRQTLITLNATREMVTEVKTKAVTTLDKVEVDMPGLVGKAEETLDNIKATSANIKQISVDVRGPILDLIDDGRQISADTRRIVGSAKEVWPLNAILPVPGHELVLPDSVGGSSILKPQATP